MFKGLLNKIICFFIGCDIQTKDVWYMFSDPTELPRHRIGKNGKACVRCGKIYSYGLDK